MTGRSGAHPPVSNRSMIPGRYSRWRATIGYAVRCAEQLRCSGQSRDSRDCAAELAAEPPRVFCGAFRKSVAFPHTERHSRI